MTRTPGSAGSTPAAFHQAELGSEYGVLAPRRTAAPQTAPVWVATLGGQEMSETLVAVIVGGLLTGGALARQSPEAILAPPTVAPWWRRPRR